MKSYRADSSLQKEWFVVDASGKRLGRLASQVAAILIGKHKPQFTPGVDTGDYVIVINTDKLVLTGNKLDKKFYYRHTGYPGGLRATSYRDLMATKSDFAFEKAVERMMPKTTLGRDMLKKLHVYTGPDHKHEAQCPKALDL
jgi:large subunit ribosomal protein L13